MMALSELELEHSGLQEKIKIKSGKYVLWGSQHFLILLDPRRVSNV